MGIYEGHKALDAELLLDLDKGLIKMDYSLNKYQIGEFDSNSSFFNFNNYDKKLFTKFGDRKRYIFDVLIELLLIFAKIPLTIIFPILIHRLNVKSEFRKKYQLKWQQFQKFYAERISGVFEYKVDGQLSSKEFIYHLNNNLWFEYELDGEYKNKVKTIELRRRFVNNILDGESFIQQDGWNLIFKFKGIPMYGSCVIRYV